MYFICNDYISIHDLRNIQYIESNKYNILEYIHFPLFLFFN